MWILNIWLLLCFFFAPQQYLEMVSSGAPCYAYKADWGELGETPGSQPLCFYDPLNLNSGIPR